MNDDSNISNATLTYCYMLNDDMLKRHKCCPGPARRGARVRTEATRGARISWPRSIRINNIYIYIYIYIYMLRTMANKYLIAISNASMTCIRTEVSKRSAGRGRARDRGHGDRPWLGGVAGAQGEPLVQHYSSNAAYLQSF